jgi:hypothetical protein|tara:strand:+ start:161 stop:388 length:228 start_codon:yes stop_codon:yes gene_type:complete
MDNVFKMIKGFLTGLSGLIAAMLPVAILFQVLTGGTVFGMDVISNLTNMITSIGNGGFAGLIVLVVALSFFTDNK